MEVIKIIIVDDHELFRMGLKMALESCHPDISVVGEAGTGVEFFSLLKITTADLVLLDIMLPDINGVEIAHRLKTEHPEMKILAISAENTASVVEEMINIGIEGFISKIKCNPDTLAEAIHAVMEGTEYFGRDISEIINRIYIAKKKTTDVSAEFTEQEKQIIECCMEGLPAKLIADRLGLSIRTVDWHKAKIFRKLGINNTVEMVRFAVKSGIIRVES